MGINDRILKKGLSKNTLLKPAWSHCTGICADPRSIRLLWFSQSSFSWYNLLFAVASLRAWRETRMPYWCPFGGWMNCAFYFCLFSAKIATSLEFFWNASTSEPLSVSEYFLNEKLCVTMGYFLAGERNFPPTWFFEYGTWNIVILLLADNQQFSKHLYLQPIYPWQHVG